MKRFEKYDNIVVEIWIPRCYFHCRKQAKRAEMEVLVFFLTT